MSNHSQPQNIKLEQLCEGFTKLVNSKIRPIMGDISKQQNEKGRQASIQEELYDSQKETISKITLNVNRSSVTFEVDKDDLDVKITITTPGIGPDIKTSEIHHVTLEKLREDKINEHISVTLRTV